jgi:hypothetical protein
VGALRRGRRAQRGGPAKVLVGARPDGLRPKGASESDARLGYGVDRASIYGWVGMGHSTLRDSQHWNNLVSLNVLYKRAGHIGKLVRLYATLEFESKYNNLILIKLLETILIRKPALLDMYEQYAIKIYIYYTYVVHVFVRLAP